MKYKPSQAEATMRINQKYAIFYKDDDIINIIKDAYEMGFNHHVEHLGHRLEDVIILLKDRIQPAQNVYEALKEGIEVCEKYVDEEEDMKIFITKAKAALSKAQGQ